MTEPQTYVLPDLMAGWPFKTVPNPLWEKINAESKEWVETYNAFNAKAQHSFNRCDFGAFTALAYPRLSQSHYRAAADLVNYYFVFDELSDDKDGPTVGLQAKAIMDAMRDPDATPPENEDVLGAMARDFWKRALNDGKTSQTTADRFLRNFGEYTECVRQQAVDRDANVIRPIEEYLTMRRGTVGVRPSFDFFVLSDDLPDEVLRLPQVEELICGAIDMSILSNDIYSFNVEQSRGDGNHNLVSVTMAEKGMSIQEAMDDIGKRYAGLAASFLETYRTLPKFPQPSIQNALDVYTVGMGTWVTTNDEWSFITPRYFGDAKDEIKKTRVVELLPREV